MAESGFDPENVQTAITSQDTGLAKAVTGVDYGRGAAKWGGSAAPTSDPANSTGTNLAEITFVDERGTSTARALFFEHPGSNGVGATTTVRHAELQSNCSQAVVKLDQS